MILARITQALRDQNWLAVSLEFIIVILGVVIGFQVTQWSSSQAEAERRAVALDRLHDEVEDAVSALRLMTTNYDRLNTTRTEVIERLIADDLEGIGSDADISSVTSTSLLPAFSPRQGVYTEIISSGMLSSLGDEDFRDALGDYQAGVTFLQGQIDYFRTIVTTRPKIADFDYVYLEYAPGTVRQRRHVVEWDAAAADPDFLQFLLDGNNSMRAMSDWWEHLLERAETLCAQTGRLTGQPCAPPETSE